MHALKAQVKNGKLVLDEPTDPPAASVNERGLIDGELRYIGT